MSNDPKYINDLKYNILLTRPVGNEISLCVKLKF